MRSYSIIFACLLGFNASAGECDRAMLPSEGAKVILLRSTPRMLKEILKAILPPSGISAGEPGEIPLWLTLDLAQDVSHLKKKPWIPSFVVTAQMRSLLNGKLDDSIYMDDMRRPRLKKMYFETNEEEFNGLKPALIAHTVIRIKPHELLAMLRAFERSVNHSTFENKIFKLDIIDN